MLTIRTDDPLAVAVVKAIHTGDVETLKRILRDNPASPPRGSAPTTAR